jgi:transposase-like protein
VKKRQRRLTGVDEIVLSLYAKGLTTYGASVSRETISRITDKVIEEMQSWQQRPVDQVCAAIFGDAIVVKIRDGQVANRPVYAAIGVTLGGEKDIVGLWAGTGGEGAKFWRAFPHTERRSSRVITPSEWASQAILRRHRTERRFCARFVDSILSAH